jgi:hypothetical protein
MVRPRRALRHRRAGFNGASFLDFNKDISSLIMALLAFAAIGSYVVAAFLLSQPSFVRASAQQSRSGLATEPTN